MKRFLIIPVLFFITQGAEAFISDDSIIWTAHSNGMYYTTDTVNWTTNKISAPSVGQIFITGISSFYGLAYDYNANQLITSHPNPNLLAIVFLQEQSAVPFYLGTSKDVGQMTIDWTARNLYWTDGGYGWIAMKRLPDTPTFNSFSQSVKLVVDSQLDKPTGITVYPDRYYLFWADAGTNPKIERSSLVGNDRTVITWYNLISPTCLTIDFDTDLLYWSDPIRGTIEYTDFDGNGRNVFASDPDLDYYGIVVFQDNLIFTAPSVNTTGVYSLNENIYGRIGRLATMPTPVYFIDVYDKEAQPREDLEACDSEHIGCSQICVHAEMDRGATCHCTDGYTLNAGDGKTCETDGFVLERHLLYTNASSICSISINFINNAPLSPDCDVISHEYDIRNFALDMGNREIFFASGSEILKAKPHDAGAETIMQATGEVIDLDFDWKTKELFWIVSGGRGIHYMSTNGELAGNQTKGMSSEVTNIAVDPQNKIIYFIRNIDNDASLLMWYKETDEIEEIRTVRLDKPTDLEYHRPSNRLFWNDAAGFVGVVYSDGSNEQIFQTETTGQDRYAVTVFKKFILSTTAETNRHMDVIYEQDLSQTQITMWIHIPILDMHVYDMTLQPFDLEPCEKNNGGCEHICVPEITLQCSCYLGYSLQDDNVSCRPTTLPDNNDYLITLDSLNFKVHQIALSDNAYNIRAVSMHTDDEPSGIAFDMERNTIVWMDQRIKRVKKKVLDDPKEIAVGSNLEQNAEVAVDVTGGNIYVTSGRTIKVIDVYENEKTILDQTDIVGTPRKIEVMAEIGMMAWVETGTRSRLMIAFMNGDYVRVILDNIDDDHEIEHPEDLSFDHETGQHLYWCDSDLGKIERVALESFTMDAIIADSQHLNPVALDVARGFVYFITKNERKVFSIAKNGEGGVDVIMESPLFGGLTHIFVSKALPKGHVLCSDCNGECSTLCLPRGEDGRRCACEDGSGSSSDVTTCPTAELCPDPVAQGLAGVDSCCRNLPNIECQPNCKIDFSLKYGFSVKCMGGQWNVSFDSMCQTDDSETTLPIAVVAGAAGGGAVVIIVIIVIVIVCRRRSHRNEGRRPTLPHITDLNGGMANGRHPYDTGDGISPPQPPSRPLTTAEEEDGGEYTYLDESLIAKRVDLPDKDDKDGIQKGRASNRYSNFPGGKKDPYYLTPSTEFTPMPDYPQYGLDNPGLQEDGYLAASSVSGRSNFSNETLNFDYVSLKQRDTGYLAASSIGGHSQRGSDFSEMNDPNSLQRDGAIGGLMTSVPRDSKGVPFDIPMAHFGNFSGTSSSAQSSSSPYQTSISKR